MSRGAPEQQLPYVPPGARQEPPKAAGAAQQEEEEVEYLDPKVWKALPVDQRRNKWRIMWIRTRPASDWGGKQKWSYREKQDVANKYWKDKQEHNPEVLLADVQYWWDTWVPLHPPKKQKILVERQCFGAIRTTWLESPDDYDFFNLYAQIRLANPESTLYRELLEAMRQLPVVLDLWEQVKARQEQIKEDLGALEQSVSLELSNDPESPGILHTHAVESCVTAKRDQRLTYQCGPDEYKVLGRPTDLNPNSSKGRHARKSMERLHSYCQTQKKGLLFFTTNHRAGKHFWQNYGWLMELWYMNKISDWQVERELASNKHMCAKGISLVRECAEVKQRHFMEDRHTYLKAHFAQKLTGWKVYEEGNLFRAQFNPANWGENTRFKFLVLVGGSGLGKTRWACHLFGVEYTLVVDCQDAEEPNLNLWRPDFHLCLVLDEANPKLVLRCKTLLQSGVEGAILYQSRCQGFARYFNLYMCPIVICTNEWIDDLRHPVESHPKNWLLDNSFVIRADSHMFQ